MVQWWMLGVSHHASGMISVIGIRPRKASSERTRQCPKFGNEMITCRPMRSRCSSTIRGLRVAWMVWDSTTTSKASSG